MQMGGKIGIQGTYETILNDPLLPKNITTTNNSSSTTNNVNDDNNNEQESKQQNRINVEHTHVAQHNTDESTDDATSGNVTTEVIIRYSQFFMCCISLLCEFRKKIQKTIINHNNQKRKNNRPEL